MDSIHRKARPKTRQEGELSMVSPEFRETENLQYLTVQKVIARRT
jgi:hypothetical protein